MSTEHDDLRRQLERLDEAVADAHLPGPAAARHRARQRSRRQATGAALGAVAAVAVGVLVVGGLPSVTSAPVLPAHTPTPTGEPTTGPPIGDALVLTADELEANSGHDELVGWTATDDSATPSFECAPVPGDADVVAQRSFVNPGEGRLDQFVEISTADRAGARFADITEGIVACVEQRNADNPTDNWMNVIWTVDGIGDATWQADYAVEPRSAADELMIVTVSVVHVGDAVTVITQGGPGMHGHEIGPLPYELAAAAAAKLCGSAGDSCVADPQPHRVYPAAAADVPGWLTAQDVADAIGVPEITEAGEPYDAEGQYWFICFDDPNPEAAGATSVERRSYVDPQDMVVTSVDEALARFTSSGTAAEHYQELVAAGEGCVAQGDADEVASVDEAEYQGRAWRSTGDIQFGFGVVSRGPAVAVVVLTPGDPTDEITDDELRALLARAGERLADLD